MFVDNINPVLATIGPFEIRYYGLFYVIGFILAYFILKKLVREHRLKLSNELIEDFLVYAGIYGILGARIFYVLIYNGAYYLNNPLEIFAIWHGGLSFHGALIGALIGVYLFSKKHNFDFLKLMDIAVIPFVLGLGIGRIGNFLNGELYGRITSVPWCVKFPYVDGCRHPSQLYESAYSFFIFAVLWTIRNKRMRKGMLTSWFILLYSLLRFFTEFFRAPDPQLGFIVFGLTMGQVLCVIMFVAGLTLLYSVKRQKL